MVKKPNYLIIGTMKGGTTVLNDFICKHPAVSRSTVKEIHYFSLFPDKGIEWYLSHFPDDPDHIVGEASPTYFDVAYTQAIPRLIREFDPDIKLILIVRNPLDRAVSQYYHFRDVNKFPVLDDIDVNEFFSQSCESILRQTTQLEYLLHQCIDFSIYTRKFMNYRSVFGPNQILTLGNWELKADPRTTMNRVFDYLGVEQYYDKEFQSVKYSSGKNKSQLSKDVQERLKKYFDVDFALFCKMARIKYTL